MPEHSGRAVSAAGGDVDIANQRYRILPGIPRNARTLVVVLASVSLMVTGWFFDVGDVRSRFLAASPSETLSEAPTSSPHALGEDPSVQIALESGGGTWSRGVLRRIEIRPAADLGGAEAVRLHLAGDASNGKRQNSVSRRVHTALGSVGKEFRVDAQVVTPGFG